MARIPMGNFGNAMPEVERIAVPQNNLDQLGSAIANAGSSVHGAFQEIDKQKQEAELSAKRLELYNNDLAKQEALSINYLSHFFQNHLGMSFQSYLNHIRCEKAHFLIKNTEMSLLNISEACGFSDLRYLNRAFEQIYHFTPKEYRKQLQIDSTQPEEIARKKIQEQEFIHSKTKSLAVTTQLLTNDFFDN